MTLGVKAFQGKRLQEARLAHGLYMKSLGDMIGISGAAVGRYEDGTDKPHGEKLRALADQLKFPLEFFLRPQWPETIELVFWRSRTSETKSAREMTEQRMRWLCEIFAFLEQEVNFPAVSLPELDVPQNFNLITPEVIERVAMELRNFWKLRSFPIPDMTLALENAGIPVVNLEIVSDKQDGFCFRSNHLCRTFVGINVYNVSAARARYDLSHELAHAVLHKHVTVQQARDPASHKLLEQQAHRFAGAFLFPRDAFFADISIPSLDYFSDRKKKWGISIAAMVFRAHDLGMIDDYEKTILYKSMTRKGWRGSLREPFDSETDMPLERPRMLRRGIETVLGMGIFGRSAIQSALALPSREIERIVGVPLGFLRETEAVSLVTPKHANLTAVDLESGNVVEFPRRKSN